MAASGKPGPPHLPPSVPGDVVAGIVMLTVAAIGLNTKTDGGTARDFIAGLAAPISLGLVAIVVTLRLSLRLKRR